jgi:hypothetical protein
MRRLLGTVALALAVAACTSAAAPAAPAHASKTSGDYRLDLDLPKTVWQAAEPISGTATLANTSATPIALYGSGSGPLVFSYKDVATGRTIEGVSTADCGGPTMLDSSKPITASLSRSGAFQPGNPDDAWREAFIERGVLPAGTWEIRVEAQFAVAAGCGGRGSKLQTSVQIEVR